MIGAVLHSSNLRERGCAPRLCLVRPMPQSLRNESQESSTLCTMSRGNWCLRLPDYGRRDELSSTAWMGSCWTAWRHGSACLVGAAQCNAFGKTAVAPQHTSGRHRSSNPRAQFASTALCGPRSALKLRMSWKLASLRRCLAEQYSSVQVRSGTCRCVIQTHTKHTARPQHEDIRILPTLPGLYVLH